MREQGIFYSFESDKKNVSRVRVTSATLANYDKRRGRGIVGRMLVEEVEKWERGAMTCKKS